MPTADKTIAPVTITQQQNPQPQNPAPVAPGVRRSPFFFLIRVRNWFLHRDPGQFADRRANITFIGIYLSLLLLPALFSTTEGTTSVTFSGRNLPPGCLSRDVFGTDCPGCGLGRSFVHIAHGRFAQALALHRLSIPLYLFFAAQAAFRIWCLIRKSKPVPQPAQTVHHYAALIMVILLIANWLLGLFLGGNGF